MEEIDINIPKILSSLNMDSDAEIVSKLANFDCNSTDDNVMEILHSINGIGYEIDENLYSLPSMTVNRLNERKKQIITSHHELARRYYDSLTFSKRLQKKLSLLNNLYDILHTKYYLSKVILKFIFIKLFFLNRCIIDIFYRKIKVFKYQ